MSETRPNPWQQLDPMLRSVVALYSGRIGDVSEGDLSSDEFIAATTEAFPGIAEEDITRGLIFSEVAGLRTVATAELKSTDAERVGAMATQLGILAGGGEAVMELATQAGEVLTTTKYYKAQPALRVLSELAVSNLLFPPPEANT